MTPKIDAAEQVPSLHRDADAGVRRSALLAVCSVRELVADEDLLPLLHDSDSEVRQLCEAIRLGRGLRKRDLTMGRLITDCQFLKRLEILNYLGRDDQIDPQAWLERLSQNSVPAVRAATLRVAFDSECVPGIDFSERAQQMASSDPDGTVRQIAMELVRMRLKYRMRRADKLSAPILRSLSDVGRVEFANTRANWRK
jgi:hypothetical protein